MDLDVATLIVDLDLEYGDEDVAMELYEEYTPRGYNAQETTGITVESDTPEAYLTFVVACAMQNGYELPVRSDDEEEMTWAKVLGEVGTIVTDQLGKSFILY
ncbi:hypothetical protein [Vibrio phage V-YDF132]|nr:hypothetical protein [Vibrio phage V-YDF132]